MEELIKFGLLCFTTFFTIINPLGVMPVFMTMTSNLTSQQRSATATKALVTAFFTMVGFAFSGNLLFEFFGISVASFRVVGGIIFFMMGYDMLQARLIRTKMQDEDAKAYVTDISITPLAIPMICGPGAITNSIVLMQDAHSFALKAVLIGVMFFVSLITLLVLLASGKISQALGDTGNKILMRLMGLIVMVVAVEFTVSGLKPIVAGILKAAQ
ncbi:MarC family protein [Hugenholtzia roseola]|uniref:MarC family protein n=1 Tax=Hugenholtzia roseola TaxID=1002 RepID=UPI00047B208E|nr:MarC family protein [Hugenholtzia roseola]